MQKKEDHITCTEEPSKSKDNLGTVETKSVMDKVKKMSYSMQSFHVIRYKILSKKCIQTSSIKK